MHPPSRRVRCCRPLPGRSCPVVLLLFASFLPPRQGLLCFPGGLAFRWGRGGGDGGCPQWP